MKILAISSSPRRGGNSETLLDEALSAANKKGAVIKKIILADLDIKPCNGCLACMKTGECVIKDDMQPLYKDLLAADVLLVSCPIYFKGMACQLKCAIDRCQALWARKYVLKKGSKEKKSGKRGAAILVCASVGVKDMFTGALITLRAWFATLDADYKGELLAQGLEDIGDARKNKRLLSKAAAFGKDLFF